ncbi:CapA family protein [Legionella hackeliae]|uniref:Putative Capsule biosynthesis protein capA n=1 Tax=Legionella hackeliae TaxID=449 RepID=A0A0A8UT36_LEGHA|nr:CapA family protein [Legionella hackeliae]KTD12604.1 capsule biosynthesis protein [Legionella hackeliae]CEK12020.1 putative Capsule biosynthesis protein capA [Legionella hackeliae]STX48803.1 capsule biosynthesis protein [Legionella hackeliae]
MSRLILAFSFWLFSPLFAGNVHIIAVGDVLLHKPLQKTGMEKGFSTLWLAVIPQLDNADITYGNLEGPAAEMLDSRGNSTTNIKEAYTAFPMFNYPPSLISALKLSGFDVVSTANNHTLDRWGTGIDKTIANLQTNAIAFTGTRRQNSEDAWFAETTSNNVSIAWLACTQDTNGIADKHRQVLHCYRDKQQVLQLISELAKTHDAVIVTPHWGVEYQTRPNKAQQALAKEFAEAGALAILGSHPHCVQPFAWLTTQNGRKVFVAYSLGNFISNQGSLKNRSSGLLSLHLEKNENGRISIAKILYQPTFMENRGNQMRLTLVTSKKHPAYQWLKKVIGEGYLILPTEEKAMANTSARSSL